MSDTLRGAMVLSKIEVEILQTEGLTRAEGDKRFGDEFFNLWYRGHITPSAIDGDPDTTTFHPTPLGWLALKLNTKCCNASSKDRTVGP